jgi:hypothetical protein
MLTLTRMLAAGAAISATAAVLAVAGEPPAGRTEIACTNLVSHAGLQINIDFQKRTVNSNPARIGDAQITWHDGKENANYTLDRKTGALESVIPSSTGGYFLHYQCKLSGS